MMSKDDLPPDLAQFLDGFVGIPEKPEPTKPHPNPTLKSMGWKPLHPNEEIPW